VKWRIGGSEGEQALPATEGAEGAELDLSEYSVAVVQTPGNGLADENSLANGNGHPDGNGHVNDDSLAGTYALGVGTPLAPMELTSPRADADWRIETGGDTVTARSTLAVIAGLAHKLGHGGAGEYDPVALGFSPLDKALAGGLRNGEMLLMGGAQGTGKTTMALQMARNIAYAGAAEVLYLCFEHDEDYLLGRLIAMESALHDSASADTVLRQVDVRQQMLETAHAGQGADITQNRRLRPALEAIARYAPRLFLMRGSQTTSTVDNLRQLVAERRRAKPDGHLVVFVDYLQKVPVIPSPATEEEKVTVVVNGLKDIALSNDVSVVSIVAADKEGLKAARLRNHHLRGSSAINYEADIILILNEKYSIVAKTNLEYNPYQAQRFRDWTILTVEKNRAGAHSIDMQFQKHFEYSVFDPEGMPVPEKLIEERLYND
jgi:replicative DNA helicase